MLGTGLESPGVKTQLEQGDRREMTPHPHPSRLVPLMSYFLYLYSEK